MGIFVVSYSISTSNHNPDTLSNECRFVVSYSISTSNHNVKLQYHIFVGVVSYSISTSNHNTYRDEDIPKWLYLIPFLHQTTTALVLVLMPLRCILFHFYIKPQPFKVNPSVLNRCILFHFYIKPQQSVR